MDLRYRHPVGRAEQYRRYPGGPARWRSDRGNNQDDRDAHGSRQDDDRTRCRTEADRRTRHDHRTAGDGVSTDIPEWERQLKGEVAELRRHSRELAQRIAAVRGRAEVRGLVVEADG